MKRYDCLVIGAGVAGLSSALLLARFGHSVAILEQATKPAPLIDGFNRNGVYFDAGFHYAGGLGAGGVLDLNLRLLGVSEKVEKTAFNFEYDYLRRPDDGFDFAFLQGYKSFAATLIEKFPADRKRITLYLERLRAATRQLPYYHPDSRPVTDLSLLHRETLAGVLDELEIKGDLRTIFELHTLLHGVSSDEIPFAIHAGVVDGYYESVHTFRGGGRTLARALAAAAREAGIKIFTNSPVTTIELSPAGHISGLKTNTGDFFAGNKIIATLHPQSLLRLLPNTVFRPAYRHRLAGLKESLSGEIVFLSYHGSSGHQFDRGRNFFFLPPAGHPLNTSLPVEKRLMYLNFSDSLTNSTDLQKVNQSETRTRYGITAILPAPVYYPDSDDSKDETKYRCYKEKIGEIVRCRVASQLRELTDSLQVETVATGRTLQRVNAAARGSLYGVSHRVDQFNPTPRTRLRGLWLAGQATAAPGVLGAITSALITVGEMVGHERVRALRQEVL